MLLRISDCFDASKFSVGIFCSFCSSSGEPSAFTRATWDFLSLIVLGCCDTGWLLAIWSGNVALIDASFSLER